MNLLLLLCRGLYVILDLVATNASESSSSVNFRPPPILDLPQAAVPWHVPPPGWFYGTWDYTYTSNIATRSLYNVQVRFDPIPVESFQISNVSELFSAQTAGESAILTLYQIDIPEPDIAPYVFRTISTMCPSGTVLAQSEYCWIAWGVDTAENDFFSLYHAATIGPLAAPASIDFLSRVVSGPTNDTRIAVLQQVLDLGNDDLSVLAGAVEKINQDGGRTGTLPISCDVGCQANNGTNSL